MTTCATVISLELNCVWPNESLHFADIADLQPFADHDDGPAGSPQQAVDLVGHLLERDWPLGQVDLQRQFAFGDRPGGPRRG